MSPLQDQRIISIAAEMIKRGARVPVVEAMLPIRHNVADALYNEVTGEAAKTGPLPCNHLWYVNTLYPMRIVQSSILYGFHKAISKKSPNALQAEILIAAYDLYVSHCESIGAEQLITFCRAWHLLREIKIKNLIMAKCSCCSSSFVFDSTKLHFNYECPLCKRSPSLSASRYRRKEKDEAIAIAA